MTEFHEEYQQVFGEKASIHTIMKRRISHMNPPIPKSVCEEEMQNANLDTNEVIIEYITDAQGNKVKMFKPLLIKSEPDREYVHHIHSDDNLPAVPEDNFIQKREVPTDAQGNKVKMFKPLLIKSEPDREYVHHIHSDDNLPAVPEDNFIQKREVTVDSYSETISSNISSDDRTITTDSDSSAASSFEETPYKCEMDSKGIEATLHQIASGLQNATEGYLTLAFHISGIAPY